MEEGVWGTGLDGNIATRPGFMDVNAMESPGMSRNSAG